MDPTQATASPVIATTDQASMSWRAVVVALVALGGLGVFGAALFFRNLKHGIRSRRR